MTYQEFDGRVDFDPAPQPCGATRPALTEKNWECNGVGLIIIMIHQDLPVIDPEPWWDLPIKPFAGGDHFHLVVPRRPTPPFKTDTTLITGSEATRWRELGPIIDGSVSTSMGDISLGGGTRFGRLL